MSGESVALSSKSCVLLHSLLIGNICSAFGPTIASSDHGTFGRRKMTERQSAFEARLWRAVIERAIKDWAYGTGRQKRSAEMTACEGPRDRYSK
jgi:hypothetical protein